MEKEQNLQHLNLRQLIPFGTRLSSGLQEASQDPDIGHA